MNQHVIVAAARDFLAVYLIITAAAALLGRGRIFLAYPARIAYSLVSMTLALVTAGHVTVTPLGRKVRRQSLRRMRAIRYEIADWRALRKGENLVAAPVGSGSWQTSEQESADEFLPAFKEEREVSVEQRPSDSVDDEPPPWWSGDDSDGPPPIFSR